MDTRGDDELKKVRDWMLAVLEAHPDLTATSWAKKADMAATNVTRHVNPKPGVKLFVPKTSTLRALSKAAGVALPTFATGADDEEDVLPDQSYSVRENDHAFQALPKSRARNGAIDVPEYDIKVAAGGGYVIDAENEKGLWSFSRDYIVTELRLNPQSLSIVEVTGDSMEPKLMPGDRILVNHADTNPSPPGIFALWDGYGLVVKKVQRVHGTDRLLLISENTTYPPYEVLMDEITIVGRVRWCGRRM